MTDDRVTCPPACAQADLVPRDAAGSPRGARRHDLAGHAASTGGPR
ncbi:hypothetical protein [Actinomycetospora chibensis]|uniref:Uncharacterized protein n=1 Tax=Actinomycetospora chibensis TaxID=663606 RepID=A0ABV9RM44_9PSEU|nr:hypothetical protein [Actinomycetospora chibensis]MDD7922223.1 hypothetical protein [Actinomycetospora chibensis]